MEPSKEKEIDDLMQSAYKNIANAREQKDGMTAVCCLLGSIAHSLAAMVELQRNKNEPG